MHNSGHVQQLLKEREALLSGEALLVITKQDEYTLPAISGTAIDDPIDCLILGSAENTPEVFSDDLRGHVFDMHATIASDWLRDVARKGMEETQWVNAVMTIR